ncbi:MAG: hypothetical protein HOC71_04850 [Candidatus Latescibacteria bacterium]|jgi:hypothetical protein|nr:hypothetical protein [Candidatus Latescibacterota bacterium]
MIKSVLWLFYTIFVFSSSTQAEDFFLTSGSARLRALAMGSAYNSVEDDFSAGFYNPGAFKLNATQNERRFRLFFNPLAAAVALNDFSNYNTDYNEDDKLTLGEALLSVSLFIKGMVYTTPVLDMGLGLGEEMIEGNTLLDRSERIFSVEGLIKNSFHSAFINLKVAPSVSLGISGTLYSSWLKGGNSFEGGYAFGVLLMPNPKMNVGIVYNEIPEKFSGARMELECLENGAVTSGISYHPDDKTVFSLDLRGVNLEDQPTARQIHTGLERRFGERITLRAGYFRKKDTRDDVFSFGIGVLPVWEKISRFSHSTRNDLVSYTLIMEDTDFEKHWHAVSMLLRF